MAASAGADVSCAVVERTGPPEVGLTPGGAERLSTGPSGPGGATGERRRGRTDARPRATREDLLRRHLALPPGVYVALVLLPLLRYRAGKALDLSDAIFVVAAVFLVLSRRPPAKAPPAPAWYFGSFVWVLAAIVASSQAMSKAASLEVVLNAIFVFFVLQWMLRQVLNSTERIRAGMIAFILGSSVVGLRRLLADRVPRPRIQQPGEPRGLTGGGPEHAAEHRRRDLRAGLVFAIGLVADWAVAGAGTSACASRCWRAH